MGRSPRRKIALEGPGVPGPSKFARCESWIAGRRSDHLDYLDRRWKQAVNNREDEKEALLGQKLRAEMASHVSAITQALETP